MLYPSSEVVRGECHHKSKFYCCAVLYQFKCMLWNCLSNNRPMNPFDCPPPTEAAYSCNEVFHWPWVSQWVWSRPEVHLLEGSTHYCWKKASDPLWSLVALWSLQEITHPFQFQFPLEVRWCLMRFLFFISWVQMAFAGGWSSLGLGSISDCWSAPPTCCRSSFWRGQASSEIIWWWHVDPATDILVWITDPLYGGLNLFPHSVTNLVRISNSFCFIVVLVSVWHNPPHKIMCSLEACFHILHTSWDTLMEFCSWTVSHLQVNSGRWTSLPKSMW